MKLGTCNLSHYYKQYKCLITLCLLIGKAHWLDES